MMGSHCAPNPRAACSLDAYIHDYLAKRNFVAAAKAFQAEAKLPADFVAIDTPGGFLYEWWSVFWDIFIARTNENHSADAAAYLEIQRNKNQEQQTKRQQQVQQHSQEQLDQQNQLQQFRFPSPTQHHQLQSQQQSQVQQPRSQPPRQQQSCKEGVLQQTDNVNKVVSSEHMADMNAISAKSFPAKGYLQVAKATSHQAKAPNKAPVKRHNENIGRLFESNIVSSLKAPALSRPPSGQASPLSTNSMLGHGQYGNHLQAAAAQDISSEALLPLNIRSGYPDSPLIGQPGINQAGSSLTLNGRPLTGVDHLRSRAGFLQPKSCMQSPQPMQHIQFLSPHQQHLLAQAQQSSLLSSHEDHDGRRFRMIFDHQNFMSDQSDQFSLRDVTTNVGPQVRSACSMPLCQDTEALIKKIAQMQHQHQNIQANQRPMSYINEEKLSPSNVAVEGCSPNSFSGNAQVIKNRPKRKRKPPKSSPAPANSSETTNSAGPSPSSPSTHTLGDVVSISSLCQNTVNSSRALIIYGCEDNGALNSVGKDMTNIDCLVESCVDDSVDSLLAPEDANPRSIGSKFTESTKGFPFNAVGSAHASTSKVTCCHFSPDGKLLASGGHDKKAVLWYTDTLQQKSVLDGHSSMITDVRFSPMQPHLATSSFDKTVRIWDIENQGYTVRTFSGPLAAVMSLDFHPNKDDLLCSCDGDGEICYWNLKNGTLSRVFKGGSSQVRFQSHIGRYLAAAADNVVSIFDVETQACFQSFQGHKETVDSITWDPLGEFLVSVSEDSVRVWSITSGQKDIPIHVLSCSGSKFHSCVFHPTYSSFLVIGCDKTLELWDMPENRSLTIEAHSGLIASMSASSTSGLIASASHDTLIKLWK